MKSIHSTYWTEPQRKALNLKLFYLMTVSFLIWFHFKIFGMKQDKHPPKQGSLIKNIEEKARWSRFLDNIINTKKTKKLLLQGWAINFAKGPYEKLGLEGWTTMAMKVHRHVHTYVNWKKLSSKQKQCSCNVYLFTFDF